jgi:homoserine O-acetyltransferase
LENKPTTITLHNFTTESGAIYNALNLSYQVFGCITYGSIVLVNHALTEIQVVGDNGWWNDLIGANKPLILQNIPYLF